MEIFIPQESKKRKSASSKTSSNQEKVDSELRIPSLPQSPTSFSHSGNYSLNCGMINLFGKWVKLKDGDKKSSFLSKKQKASDYVLLISILKQLWFYEDEDRKKDPILEYDLSDSSFTIRSSKVQKILITAFDNSDGFMGRKKVNLKVQCLNSIDFNELIRHLKECGVTEKTSTMKQVEVEDEKKEEEEYEGEGTTLLESLEEKEERVVNYSEKIDSWSTEDVLKWSSDILVGKRLENKFSDYVGDTIRDQKITGQKILSWDDDDIDEFVEEYNENKSDLRRISREIKNMRDSGTHDPSDHLVLVKIVKMLEVKHASFKNFNTRSHAFRLRAAFRRHSEVKTSLLNIMYGENHLETNIHRKPKTFSVKVSIVENLEVESEKRIRKVLSVLLDFKDAVPMSKYYFGVKKVKKLVGDEEGRVFGIFHSSLQIGGLQLEWVNAELVIVRPVGSEKVVLCSDVGQIAVPDGDVLAHRLAKQIIDWNVKYKYVTFGGGGKKEDDYAQNCQHFVLRTLRFLEIDWDIPARVQRFINYMKYTGKAEKVFRFDRKFSDMFFQKGVKIKEEDEEDDDNEEERKLRWRFKKKLEKVKKSKEFRPEAHKELDWFVQRCFKICPHFDRDFNGEYMLLKGFDRAFWMSYRSVLLGLHKLARSKKEVLEDDKHLIRNLKHDKRKLGKFWRVSGCPFTPPKDIE